MLNLINHQNPETVKRSDSCHTCYHLVGCCATTTGIVLNVVRFKKIIECLKEIEAQSFCGAIERTFQFQPCHLDVAKLLSTIVMVENDLRIEHKETLKREAFAYSTQSYHC